MAIDRTRQRWQGWGPIDAPDPLGDRAGAWEYLAQALGATSFATTPALPFEAAMLPPPLEEADLARLSAVVGGDRVLTDSFHRACRARGKSYPDLHLLRSGDAMTAPGAVVLPNSTDEIVAILQQAEGAGLAVIPFGGGTSVVGGATGGGTRSIALDLTRMDRLLDLNETDRTATFEAGIDGPALEAALHARGFTLGHAPQSFLYSTLGGWIAASGSGQQSGIYGRAADWFVRAELATPRGVWRTESFPANAAGPWLGRLVVGGEGVFGVIANATVRIRPTPETRDYRGYVLPSFSAGAEAIRNVVQAGVPAMLRLSDEDETKFLSGFSTFGRRPSLRRRLGEAYLHARGFSRNFCLLIAGFEGEGREVVRVRRAAETEIRRAGGLALGRSVGDRWYERRFHGPDLRDPLLDRGVGVDTLETATRWSNLQRLYEAVRGALAASIAAGSPGRGVVMTHVSHSYPEGASLYFTFLFLRRPGEEIAQWRAIKTAASAAIMDAGGAITHHHGVGVDHLPWMMREKGPIGVEILRAIRKTVDAKGVLNPGKLIP
jgi:alkyldihydroxyacetonephosphate synthase